MLPKWLNGKKSAYPGRRCRFEPWVRKIPWRRAWQPNLIFLPGKSHGQRSPVGSSPRGWGRIRHDLVTKQQQPNKRQWECCGIKCQQVWHRPYHWYPTLLYQSAQAAITKYQRLADWSNRNLLCQFWRLEAWDQGLVRFFFNESCLPGLQMAAFSLSLHGGQRASSLPLFL